MKDEMGETCSTHRGGEKLEVCMDPNLELHVAQEAFGLNPMIIIKCVAHTPPDHEFLFIPV
jgi:hypothetical protein